MESAGDAAVLVVDAFAEIPLALLLCILARLPVDARLRCAEVSRGWQATLLERSLWTRLDLSAASGGLAQPATDNLLRAAAEKAGGMLQALDVSGHYISHGALLAVMTANAGALRELRDSCFYARNMLGRTKTPYHRSLQGLHELLHAGPQLQLFETNVWCEDAKKLELLARALRNEEEWAPLRVRHLELDSLDVRRGEEQPTLHEVAAAMAGHTSLTGVNVSNAMEVVPAALDALVDAVLACPHMRSFRTWLCGIDAASVPALMRLVQAPSLAELAIDITSDMDLADVALLSAALRANTSLTSLTLECGSCDQLRMGMVLAALTGHPHLRELELASYLLGTQDKEEEEVHAHAGGALGALVAANSPALQKLELQDTSMGDAGLLPLLDALPHNTHLCSLVIFLQLQERVTETFVRGRLLPAVHANTSLVHLDVDNWLEENARAAVGEAEAFVKRRAATRDGQQDSAAD
jgi:hypothetical protein